MAQGWKKDYFRYKDFFLNILSVYNAKPNLKVYLELILSLATIIVFSLFAIKPTILTIIDLNNEIKSKEETSAKLKQKIQNLQTASNLLQTEANNISYIDQAVPNKATAEVLVKQIESLSIESGLKILGFSASDITLVGKATDTKKAKEIENLPNNADELPFSFSATGTYTAIFSFLNKIEELRRPIRIDSFIINSNVTESGKTLIMTVTGRVPFLLDQ